VVNSPRERPMHWLAGMSPVAASLDPPFTVGRVLVNPDRRGVDHLDTAFVSF
jgi:hypothetical protein